MTLNHCIPVGLTICAACFAGVFLLARKRLRTRGAGVLKEQLDYQNTLRELSAKMTRIRNLNDLVRTITLTLVDSAHTCFSAVYLKENSYAAYQLKSIHPDDSRHFFQEIIPTDMPVISALLRGKKPLQSEDMPGLNLKSGIIVPFIIEDDLLGFMLLGHKPEKRSYTIEDIQVFENLSYSASLAIENCRFWNEIEDRHRKARLQEMDTYSYSLAHEIDNPIQVILGQGWLLRNEFLKDLPTKEKKDEAGECFDYLMEAAKRVSGMVKAIRDFGQPTTGELKVINIESVVDAFEKLYFPQFKNHMVIFEKKFRLQERIFIQGEKPALMQVLVILANNSIHAMKGTRERKILLKLEKLNKDWVRISFSDNGYGIKQELLSVIFTPFTTTKASIEGSGMGLYNAKMIIEHHKGRIWAESEGEGKGAAFIIELPVFNGDTGKITETESKRLY